MKTPCKNKDCGQWAAMTLTGKKYVVDCPRCGKYILKRGGATQQYN